MIIEKVIGIADGKSCAIQYQIDIVVFDPVLEERRLSSRIIGCDALATFNTLKDE